MIGRGFGSSNILQAAYIEHRIEISMTSNSSSFLSKRIARDVDLSVSHVSASVSLYYLKTLDPYLTHRSYISRLY